MTVFVSDEVLENRTLASEQPEVFRLANTDFIWCEEVGCGNRLEVFAGDVDFTWWHCGECEDFEDNSDDFPLWMEYDEGE